MFGLVTLVVVWTPLSAPGIYGPILVVWLASLVGVPGGDACSPGS